MKRVFIIGVLLGFMASFNTTAQRFGIIGGITLNKLNEKNPRNIVKTPSIYGFGLIAGVLYNKQLSKKTFFEPRLSFLIKADNTKQNKYSLSYINFSPILQQQISPKIGLNVGPVLEVLTKTEPGSLYRLGVSGLAGFNFILSDKFSLNTDYQTNLNRPLKGFDKDVKFRFSTFILSLKCKISQRTNN